MDNDFIKVLNSNINYKKSLAKIIHEKNNNEFDATIFSLLIYLIACNEEAYILIINDRNTGVANYLRNVLEALVYMLNLIRNDDMLHIIKNKDYQELKKIREELKSFNVLTPIESLVLEINEITTRIKKNKNEISDESLKKLKKISQKDMFKNVDLEFEYTFFYRFFSRKSHPNIYEIIERFTVHVDMEINSPIEEIDLAIYLLFISHVDTLLLSNFKEYYELGDDFQSEFEKNINEIVKYTLKKVSDKMNDPLTQR